MTASGTIRTKEEEAIAILAYGIWEAEGWPHGRDKDHWFMAKELVSEVPEAQHPDDDAAAVRPGEGSDHAYARPAGRKKMNLPPSTWSKTDEEVDESFPASDPPGNY